MSVTPGWYGGQFHIALYRKRVYDRPPRPCSQIRCSHMRCFRHVRPPLPRRRRPGAASPCGRNAAGARRARSPPRRLLLRHRPWLGRGELRRLCRNVGARCPADAVASFGAANLMIRNIARDPDQDRPEYSTALTITGLAGSASRYSPVTLVSRLAPMRSHDTSLACLAIADLLGSRHG